MKNLDNKIKEGGSYYYYIQILFMRQSVFGFENCLRVRSVNPWNFIVFFFPCIFVFPWEINRRSKINPRKPTHQKKNEVETDFP